MVRKLTLPLLALAGILIGVFAVFISMRTPPTPKIPFPPPSPPYEHFIAGLAVLEASSENIFIGTSIPQIVTDVYVVAGDFVKKDAPLFKLDIRTPEAELMEAEAAYLRASVEYENQKTQLDLFDRLTDKRAVSENEYNQTYYATESARASIMEAQATIKRALSIIERSTIRAPMDGQVLQVVIRPGEIANLNPFTQVPLITFGPVCPTHVRVSIDEDDAWRYEKGSPATAFVRGNSSICFPLKFVRLEPLVVTKRQLTGDTAERVDTRVLQVIYKFDCEQDLPLYLGQILDVYIKAMPSNTRFGGCGSK